jgi:UDP-glucose 4-epimerase
VSRRVALTGATGFIGRHLSAHLAARGFEVIAVVRPESRHTAPEGAAVVRAPLAAAALREAFRAPSWFISPASSTRWIPAMPAVNVEGTRAVAEATLAVGARLVRVSSLAAAGPASAAAPRAEDDPPNPLTPCGNSKLVLNRISSESPTIGCPWSSVTSAACPER